MSPLYQVQWTAPAENKLIQMCVDHSDHLVAISSAADYIEVELSRAPWQRGESRQAPHIRHFFANPIAIEFEIVEDDKKVMIYTCWYRFR